MENPSVVLQCVGVGEAPIEGLGRLRRSVHAVTPCRRVVVPVVLCTVTCCVGHPVYPAHLSPPLVSRAPSARPGSLRGRRGGAARAQRARAGAGAVRRSFQGNGQWVAGL
eukprot:2895385-Pyramimonas_sp.AAC.1